MEKKEWWVVASSLNEYGECFVNDWRDIIQISEVNDYTVGLKFDRRLLFAGDDGELDREVFLNLLLVANNFDNTFLSVSSVNPCFNKKSLSNVFIGL